VDAHADVVVVGAGAAGMMAARCAALRGRTTLLLEKNQRPGLKILISGGGRCNLTTTRKGQDLEAQYGSVRGRWLRHALRAFQPEALVALIEGQGVALHEEDLEKIFPVSRRARDVLDALLRECAAARVRVHTGSPVLAIERNTEGFAVRTPNATVRASAVILATGGLSYPKTGATGDGYRLARALGHSVTPTLPALAPLLVEEPWVRELSGIVLQGVELAVLAGDGRVRQARTRPILFTHRGLSGPAPMDLSGDVEESGGAAVRFDFAPAVSAAELERQWQQAASASGRSSVAALLPPELPERLRSTLCTLAGVRGTAAHLDVAARRRLSTAVKDLRVRVEHSLGFDHAEVTRGGIPLDEIDPRTMQSKLCPGLFLCGEVIDVDGPIGGFNFQAAFATGRLAGLHA
jgi:predicted Rossmann fold flavoprotein